MTTPIALSTGLGEVMAPQTLVVPLILSPDGQVTVEPGALHGRSGIESSVRMVQQRSEIADGRCHWCAWVAVELDAASQPVRYKGLAVSELWVDPTRRLGYKSLAESVNRIAEAMRGGVNCNTMTGAEKAAVKQQLSALSPESWERSPQALKDTLT